jgi:putative NIF3 family GTP cyclohydrolase 1 type 2
MTHLSRREFAAMAISTTAAPFWWRDRAAVAGTEIGGAATAAAETAMLDAAATAIATITVEELIDRIKSHIGVEWKSESVDGIKAGDPSTAVRGVVTTSLATLAVLQQAVKAGANVVISSEPTFYSKSDARVPPARRDPVVAGSSTSGTPAPGTPPTAAPASGTPVPATSSPNASAPPASAVPAAAAPPPPADAVFLAKNDFITRNNLVVIRLNEHWRQRKPDPLALGMATALGWSAHQSASDPRHFDVPATTLDALVADVKKALQSRGGTRVVGAPQTKVRRVGLLLGSTPIQDTVAMMAHVDVILAGEVREWESVEYVRDRAFNGDGKALVLLGRIVSEDPGMKVCAEWLRTFVPEAPVTHVSAGDPYWRPAR